MNAYDRYRVDVPECDTGRVRVERFVVGESDMTNLRLSFEGRDTTPGTYTALVVDGVFWMSDTDAEARDHFPIFRQLGWCERLLINGLGLGMVLQAALDGENMHHIDVVEIDEDVIDAVGPHYAKRAAERGIGLTIHHDDAYTVKWPKGSSWSCAWHDIWPTLCTDDLDEHAKLHRRYARRTGWQGSWGHELLLRRRRSQRSQGWG